MTQTNRAVAMAGAPAARRAMILGVGVSPLTVADILAVIHTTVAGAERATLLYANTHALNLAHTQPRLRAAFNEADYVVCDGFGVKWAADFLGQPLPARLTPPDWLPDVLALAEREAYSVFFVGNAPGVAEQAVARLRRQYPGVRFAGTHHGYFDKTPGSAASDAVVRAINAARPNLLYVGFGMPAQEHWLLDNWGRLEVNVAITAGAMLDFVAGVTPRGPRWLTDHGLEWLTRLVSEPGRLWRRYLVGNPLFVARVLRQRYQRPQPERSPAV